MRPPAQADLFRQVLYLKGSGAPVLGDPTSSVLLSAYAIRLPFALFVPSLAWQPSTRIPVPTGSEFLVQPRWRLSRGYRHGEQKRHDSPPRSVSKDRNSVLNAKCNRLISPDLYFARS